MKAPISWIKEFVDIKIPLPELCHLLTMAGLEVEGVQMVGLQFLEEASPSTGDHDLKMEGISWDRDKIVVASVSEVMAHPNADRLVLCQLDDGQEEHIVLTGAPNLYPYKGQGKLPKPFKVPYAREGARIFDGHQPGQVLTTLKRARIRGVESYSMICSEKELGISDEHEGVIILDDDAPVGMPLADYMGDAVLDIAITPNIARDANILGVAREVSALTGESLRQPSFEFQADGPSIEGKVSIEIQYPELNPRFVLGLVREVKIGPSPYWVQRRLRLAGMRPINNIVDATNYAMLEVGEPLHAFDYDVLVRRAGSSSPRIITRTAEDGESLTTLDDVGRRLDPFTVLVCDTAGPLSIAGVMGGAESEVHEGTKNVLLEGAAWNFINIRRTIASQRMLSEASYRFSRGVHPATASRGVSRCLEMMREWAGGRVDKGLVDSYPLPQKDPTILVTPGDVKRWLGIDLTAGEIVDILRSLEFRCEVTDQGISATCPDHRLDIGEGVVGVADLMEEIARIYGYERIPETHLADELPFQRGNRNLELEENIRDLLTDLGLQEVVTYRLTSSEREARRLPQDAPTDDYPYVQLANPIAVDRNVMRHSLLSSVLEVVERNARLRLRQALFEIGPVFMVSEESLLPEETVRLVVVMTGPRALPAWQPADTGTMDYYDLKGVLAELAKGMHIENLLYEPYEHPSFHPGKCARVLIGERQLGVMGELHPSMRDRYEIADAPLLAADLDLQLIIESVPESFVVEPVSAYPPVLEDLAIIVDEQIPAGQIEAVILQAGGKILSEIRLFDVFRGEQIGAGKKSMAYSLTYQSFDRTLTDEEVLKVRQRILKRLDEELGAKLRT